MKLSKNVLFALVNLVVAVLTYSGVAVSPEMHQAIVDNLEMVITGALALNGIVIWILRALTDTPLAGLFTKETR